MADQPPGALLLLERAALLQHLPPAQLRHVLEVAGRLQVPAGKVLFADGEDSDSLYVVLSGSLRVYRDGLELELVGPGGVCGELALLDAGRRSASVAATTDSDLLVLSRPLFWTLIHESSTDVVLQILGDLSARMRATNESRVAEQLRRQAVRAELELERHRSLAQLVAGVAHEIGTPLGIANTAVEILRKQVGTLVPGDADRTRGPVADVLEALELLSRSILRAHRLTQDFKKVSVGQLTDVREPLDLAEAVREVVDLFGVTARQARLDVQVRDELPADRTWLGHHGSLSQVLLNLLTNVQRYAYPAGQGGPVEVRLSARATPAASYVVEVRDRGRGIPAEDLPHVFDAFFTTGRGSGGSGLGLAVVHAVVTGPLGGAVSITSEVGAGTGIEIVLPAGDRDGAAPAPAS